jgi:hypothetical protein
MLLILFLGYGMCEKEGGEAIPIPPDERLDLRAEAEPGVGDDRARCGGGCQD